MLFSRVELPFGLLSAVEKPVELQDFGKAFPQRELSCVSSSCFHQKMLQHIVHMQKAFLQCVVTKWTFKLFQHEKTFTFFFYGAADVRAADARKNGAAVVTKNRAADVTKYGAADVRVAIVSHPGTEQRRRWRRANKEMEGFYPKLKLKPLFQLSNVEGSTGFNNPDDVH